MANTPLSPQQVATQFLTHLQALKPGLDTSLQDSDWWVKAQAIGGAMAGIYSDQVLLANDPFPADARVSALSLHLQTYFQPPLNVFIPPQPASGYMAVTGSVGTPITTAFQAIYLPNGNTYQCLSGFTMAATSALVPMISISSGQDQNLLSGAPLLISSPPAGLQSAGVASGDFQNGRDLETPAEAATRIISFIQTPPAGGTVADYVRFAQQANPSVTNVSILRFPNGFGTVGVVITAGTTDIDTALDNNEPIVLVPSADLVAQVQAYINTVNPITDCAIVIGPSLLPINVDALVSFTQGDGNTILPGQTLTQAQLVAREIERAIYKTPPGGRQIAGSGFVVLSDLEEQVDNVLSNEPFLTGSLAILADRQISPLSATGNNLMILPNQVAVPGSINVSWY